MKKRYYIAAFLIALMSFIFYKISTFEIFDDEICLLKEFQIQGENYQLRIYSIPSNATIQSAIQIRKYNDGVEEVLKSYEKYNELKECYIKSDTLILNISGVNKINPSQKIKFKIK